MIIGVVDAIEAFGARGWALDDCDPAQAQIVRVELDGISFRGVSTKPGRTDIDALFNVTTSASFVWKIRDDSECLTFLRRQDPDKIVSMSFHVGSRTGTSSILDTAELVTRRTTREWMDLFGITDKVDFLFALGSPKIEAFLQPDKHIGKQRNSLPFCFSEAFFDPLVYYDVFPECANV